MDIGKKLKELRIAKDLTQEELADRAELSKGFISQLERDLTSPSIATLVDLLQVLGTTINDFFSEEAEEQIVFHDEDYFEKIDTELNNKTEWIIPNAQKNMMEPIRLTLEPAALLALTSPMKGKSSAMCSREASRFISARRYTVPGKAKPFILRPTLNTI